MSERQKYNRMWMSKQLGNKVLSISNLSELNEKKKHQIRIEKSKMKSQELRYQRQRVNQLYAKDQGKVFRKFREAIKRDIDNEKPTVPQFNNDQLRPETNITKSMNDFGPLFGGMRRNSSMEAPGSTSLIKLLVLEFHINQPRRSKYPRKW